MTDEALIVMARAPEPGRVKTRLIPDLGAEGACRVHDRLLEHTLITVAAGTRPVWMYLTGDPEPVRRRTADRGIHLARQSAGDLGQRMAAALADVHGRGFSRVVLVGSDCPVLDRAYLEAAFAGLRDADFVLGPAEDGGYVLLGSARARLWSGSPFSGVRFGGPEAGADTVEALAAHGRVMRLEPRWDVDEAADWERARRLPAFRSGSV